MGKNIRDVDNEEFVVAWQQSSSTTEVVRKLGIENREAAYSRAKRLRDQGVKLKKFSPGSVPLTKKRIDYLNSLILGEER